MPITKQELEFVSYLTELLQCIGPSQAKRMFGGHGLFIEGLMFGLVSDGVLYLKANDQSRDQFTTQGLEPFTYYKQGKPFKLSYYQVPEEALDDPQIMEYWGNLAFRSALQEAAKKSIKGRSK